MSAEREGKMNKKYILGRDLSLQEALRNKTLLEKMLPDCKIGIVCMNKNMQDNALYLELEENRIFTPTTGK